MRLRTVSMCVAVLVAAACDKKPEAAPAPVPAAQADNAKPAAGTDTAKAASDAPVANTRVEGAKPPSDAPAANTEVRPVTADAPAAPAAPAPATQATQGEVAAADAAAARVGAPAPDFTLPDLDGKPVNLASFRGKTVVLEWYNPDCPFVVKQHQEGPLKDMAKRLKEKDIVWLAINSGAPGKQGHGVERNRASVTEYGLEHPVLLDENGQVGKRYVARNTPHMYVIDPSGTLVYAGAIDNAPMGKVPPEGFVNHVEKALEDLAAGRPVAVAETRAYGCSVKYPD